MNEDFIKATLEKDVTSLNNTQKERLTGDCYVAGMDVFSKSSRAKKAMIDAGKQDGYLIEIVVRKETAKSNRRTIREQLSSFGLKESVLKDLTSRIEEGKINSTHISDIRKTNLLDDISSLNEESQQKAVEEIINIRNERDLVNSENISMLVLNSGKVSKSLVENWYRGIIRTIERLILQAEVSKDIVDELLIEQKTHLSNRIKFLIKKLEQLLISLDHQKT